MRPMQQHYKVINLESLINKLKIIPIDNGRYSNTLYRNISKIKLK